MKPFEYVELPSIPEDLHQEIIDAPNTQKLLFSYSSFSAYFCPPKTQEFLKTLFPMHDASIQVVEKDLFPHVDLRRVEAYNYIIRTGGKNVINGFHETPAVYKPGACMTPLVEEVKIEPFRWHRFEVWMPHSVLNVEELRIAVTVCRFYSDEKARKIVEIKRRGDK